MDKKKILFITNVDWFFVSHRMPIGLEALKKGYEVHLAAKFTGKEEYLISNGIKVHNIDFQRCGMSFYFSLISFLNILRIIRKIKPDLIHAITIKPVIFGGIAARIYNKASFVASISGLGYVFISKNFKARLSKILVVLSYKLALSNKKMKVIFQNNFDKNTISKICNLNNCNSLLIKGSGVDLNFYKPKKDNLESNIILFASRLLISKGIIEFIESAKNLNSKGYKFLVVGKIDIENPDCISKDDLLKYQNAGIIEYGGESNNVKDLILQSKIIVLPSYYGEGLPKILIEAAACGKPVITTDHPGCRDSIIPNKTGLLIPVKDSSSLTSAIEKLFKSKSKCIKMGAEARKFASTNFDIKEVIKKHMQIYNKLSR